MVELYRQIEGNVTIENCSAEGWDRLGHTLVSCNYQDLSAQAGVMLKNSNPVYYCHDY